MTGKRPRVFYGWLIVIVSAVGLFLGAPLVIFSFSVFFKPLVVNFHASRAAVSFAFSLMNIVGALWIPLSGVLIDRLGAKRVIIWMTLFYGLTLIAALWVGNSIWQLYLFFSILGIALSSGPVPVPYGAVISHWFNRHRGLALGLAMLGIGVGSVVVPVAAQRLITHFGWRITYALFGGAVLLVPLPIVAALLRNDPAELGLQPDGDETAPGSLLSPQSKHGITWHEIWHSPVFWMLICIFSLTGACVHGAIIHMSAIFTDRGVSAEHAALAASLIGAALIVGRLGSGYLLDHFFAPRVAILFYGATTLGLAMLWAGRSGTPALAASFLVGLGMGAEVETMGYMISRYFGLRAFGTAFGLAFGAFMLAGAAGVLLMGAGYDRFHSYTVPLAAFCGAMLLALLLLSRLGPYRYGVTREVSPPLEPVQVSSGA
jgi:MFS family permease